MVTLERLLFLYPNDLDLTVYYLDLLIELGSISKASEVVNQLLAKDTTNQLLLEELELIAQRFGTSSKKCPLLYRSISQVQLIGDTRVIRIVFPHTTNNI